MQAIRYGGAPKAPMARAEAYFEYIAQYSHPTSEGMMFLNDLPPGVYAEIAGVETCGDVVWMCEVFLRAG